MNGSTEDEDIDIRDIFDKGFNIKKGKFERTVDKAMIIALLVVIAITIVMFVIAFNMYSNEMEEIRDNIIYGFDPNKSYEDVIDEKGNILIDGKPYTISDDGNTFKSCFQLGWSVFNRTFFSIESDPDSVFRGNIFVTISCFLFFAYWIILLITYEKEHKNEGIDITMISDEDIMNKYNPLIAGCIEGNRNVIHSDIVAVLLGLINKKIIDLKTVPKSDNEDGEIRYDYILVRNRSNEVNIGMDDIERYVHSWIFGSNYAAVNEINLIEAINNVMQDSSYENKLHYLNKLANKKLHKLGANKNKVPIYLRVINCFIFAFTLIISLYAIWRGTVNFDIDLTSIIITYYAIMILAFAMPIVIFLIYSIIFLCMQTMRIGRVILSKITRKEVVSLSILVFLSFITMVYITIHFSINPGIIPYELLICITFLIMKTDNVMIQNDEEILADYSRLKLLKEKISKYSLLDERDVEYIELWDQYLTYAVAFGVAKNIIKSTDERLQGIKIEKTYLIKLIFDTINGFIEVNF